MDCTTSDVTTSQAELAAALHLPVLRDEVVAALAPQPGGRYLDGTLGLGGHALAVLTAAGEGAELCGLDRDATALELARARLAGFGQRVHLAHRVYSEFAAALDNLGWDRVDGVLLDIGVSSLQLDRAERGFSFHADGPLDMRMNPDSDDTPVSRLVNRAKVETLRDLIFRYGEDPQAARIARAIVAARDKKPFETTLELASVVERAYPAAWRAKSRNHPATRTFQALRMAVNDEIGQLETFLDAILPRVKPGGRVAVISFHSLEDRVVKHRMKAWAEGCRCPKHLPVCVCGHQPEARILTPKPLTATATELALNPRASCAKLRVAEKAGGPAGNENAHEAEKGGWRKKPRRAEREAALLMPRQERRGDAR